MPSFVRVDDLGNVMSRLRGDSQVFRAVAVMLVILAHTGVLMDEGDVRATRTESLARGRRGPPRLRAV